MGARCRRGGRNQAHRPRGRKRVLANGHVQVRIGVHARAQLEIRIGHINARRQRPCLRVQAEIHVLHFALNRFATHCAYRDARRLADMHQRNVHFVNPHLQPHLREVGNGERHAANAQIPALNDVLLDDDAVDGALHFQVRGNGLSLIEAVIQLVELLAGGAPEQQALHRRVVHVGRIRAEFLAHLRPHFIDPVARLEVVAHGRIDLGAVDGVDDVALLHRLPDILEHEAICPPGNPR